MEAFIRDASSYTPGINFSPVQGRFEMKGISLPENVIEFYSPVLEWLERYENEYVADALAAGNTQLELAFRLSYYNSGTIRYLISILNKMKRYKELGMDVTIQWYYDEEDEHLLDNGKELADLTELTFKFIET